MKQSRCNTTMCACVQVYLKIYTYEERRNTSLLGTGNSLILSHELCSTDYFEGLEIPGSFTASSTVSSDIGYLIPGMRKKNMLPPLASLSRIFSLYPSLPHLMPSSAGCSRAECSSPLKLLSKLSPFFFSPGKEVMIDP